MRERIVSREAKKALRDSIIVPTVAYASETWVWNQSQRYKIQAVEISYLRGGCGVNRMDGEGSEHVQEYLTIRRFDNRRFALLEIKN